MMVEESSSFKKEVLTSRAYGELSTDCSWEALKFGVAPFFIGAIGIPVAFRYFDKILRTSAEIKTITTVFGALSFSIYASTIAKEKCEKRITQAYTLPWLEK